MYSLLNLKLIEPDINLKLESSLEKEQIKLLDKKREREIEKVEVKENSLEESEYEQKFLFFDDNIKEKEWDIKTIFGNIQIEKSDKSLNEDNDENICYDELSFPKSKTKLPFKVIFPEVHLFTKAKNNLEENFQTKFDFSVRKKSSVKLPKFLQKHNIRVVMKERFINTYLINALKKKLKEAGYITYFEKLPQRFVRNVSKGLNNELMRKPLGKILTEKEKYVKEDKTNYEHNMALFDKIKKEEIPELNLILNTKLCYLFDEYLNSEEFLFIERNRIKEAKNKKKINEYYLQKYIYLSKSWNKFCINEKK